VNDNFYVDNGGDVGIGSRAALLHAEHINVSSGASFGSGQCFEFEPLVDYSIRLIPEGGIWRVETIRRRQRCASCGCISWWDETIACPGCQSQVFEDVL